MGKDLKAENLAVSVPNLGCNKNCPYCVSRMTGYMAHNLTLMERNAPKVVTVAKSAEITSVLLTGKGEPLLNEEAILNTVILANYFKQWPLELQTNGITLHNEGNYGRTLTRLANAGVDVIAISIDCVGSLRLYEDLYKRILDAGMIVRLTLNVTPEIAAQHFLYYVKFCREHGISQLTFRRITIPEDALDEKTVKWIRKNVLQRHYTGLITQAKKHLSIIGRKIRTLNNGVEIWDISGVAFSFSDYCIQEQDNGDNLRSLIFQEDGHLYTSWNSRASILF